MVYNGNEQCYRKVRTELVERLSARSPEKDSSPQGMRPAPSRLEARRWDVIGQLKWEPLLGMGAAGMRRQRATANCVCRSRVGRPPAKFGPLGHYNLC